MYFRKSELVNDLSNSRRSLGLPMSNDLLVKGTAIDNHKHSQELSHLRVKEKAEKGKGITASPSKKKTLKETAISKPFTPGLKVEIINKTESERKENNTQINKTLYMSLKSPTELSSRELRRPQSGYRLLRNQNESALYNLCASMGYEGEAQRRTESANLYIKRIEFPINRKHVAKLRLQPSSDMSTLSGNQEMTEVGKDKRVEDSHSRMDEACQEHTRFGRASSAKQRDKNEIKINGRSYSRGSAGKLKALHCALSRRSQSVDQTIEDEDYQHIDYEYLLRFKTVSRLSRFCDNSAIDAVAKENTMNTVEALSLPPVLGSRWKLKNRYVSGLSFNPPTPVLREYTRISQARVVDFSDTALGSQVL